MKRDDELGIGIGGSKARKFASLYFEIKKKKPSIIVVEGSLNSNNVLGITALLNSSGQKTILALPDSKSENLGNAPWIKQILNTDILKVDSTNGENETYYKEQLNCEAIFVIKEGACQIESIPGLLSLGKEIIHHQENNNVKFDNIFVDSGTGITAISTYIALSLDGQFPKYFITLIAGNEEEFFSTALDLITKFNKRFGKRVSINKKQFKFIRPTTSKSFGSINSTIRAEWLKMMNELGFPIDITYTAKHFFTVKNQLKSIDNSSINLVLNCGSWISARNHEHLLINNHQ
ncbi:MAG: hypothetical protein JXQ87_05835 [Bacteroidia bacterium]